LIYQSILKKGSVKSSNVLWYQSWSKEKDVFGFSVIFQEKRKKKKVVLNFIFWEGGCTQTSKTSMLSVKPFKPLNV